MRPTAAIVALLLLAGCIGDGKAPPKTPSAAAPGGTPPPGGGGGGGGTTFTSTGPAPAFWDSDMPLSTTWHAPTLAPGQTYWKLVSASYYPPGASASVGGDHHLYFQAKDFNGSFLSGQQGKATVFGNIMHAVTKEAVDQYRGDIPMFGTSWNGTDIDLSAGPYSFTMTQGGLPSYRVDGMGMFNNHHMTWFLVFQKAVAP
jgi:hypothetical protein